MSKKRSIERLETLLGQCNAELDSVILRRIMSTVDRALMVQRACDKQLADQQYQIALQVNELNNQVDSLTAHSGAQERRRSIRIRLFFADFPIQTTADRTCSHPNASMASG